MKRHGGNAPVSLAATRAAANAVPVLPVDDRTFRHFLRPPEPGERFTLLGQDPAKDAARSRDLLSRLGRCLPDDIDWAGPLGKKLEIWENPDIPAGYTYLAQLVAHDLVQTSTHFPSIGPGGEVFRNVRTCTLDLDTLYGPGPAACPHAYAITDRDDQVRIKLRLGPARRTSDRVPAYKPPHRDIARASYSGGQDARRQGLTEVLLADARNDDNANISQLATVFIHLHNAVVDRILALSPKPQGRATAEHLDACFGLARQMVASAFRAVVRHDLLPRLIDPAVYKVYDAVNAPILETTADGRMPLEFSHAAYRCGHAMVRPTYRIKPPPADEESLDAVLLATSGRQPWNMPLNETWIVEWSYFFELAKDRRPNLSRRIGPGMAGPLEATIRPPADPADQPLPLAAVDLLRGAGVGLWSVPALLKAIRADKRLPKALAALLPDFAVLSKQLAKWLTTHGGDDLTAAEIKSVAADPPLFLFLLFEAAFGGREGRSLGALGSVIVAESLLLALQSQSDITTGQGPDGQLMAKIFGPKPIRSMPDLLQLVADLAGLRDSVPRFL